MEEVSSLRAAEDIKCLKAVICRLIDQKDWTALGHHLTEGCEVVFGDGPDGRLRGRANVIHGIAQGLGNGRTTHFALLPVIQVNGRSAIGTWAMEDHLELETRDEHFLMDAYGQYCDEYEQDTNNRWRLSRSQSTVYRSESRPI